MEIQEIKEQLVRQGTWEPARVLDSRELEIWQRMLAPLEPKLSEHPRLVNHFALGADPELDILNQGTRLQAQTIGLHTGLAFGADMSGRQAELRPQASRWALKVVASVLQELRFLVAHVESRGGREVELKAPPWNGRDGFGGHVHFGRKQLQLRRLELQALDRAYSFLGRMGVFSLDGIKARQQAAHYGLAGDYRPQVHGYEYRSFPTWLDSPWLAYFVLTLSKLLVVKPEIADGLEVLDAQLAGSLGWLKAAETLLRGIFGYFQNLDDDARLVLWLIERVGFPRYMGEDIRGRWGIGVAEMPKKWKAPDIVPPCIEVGREQVEEVFTHLTQQRPLSFCQPQIAWEGAYLKRGFRGLLGLISTHGLIGIGELCWDLCCSEELLIRVGVCGQQGMEGADFQVGRTLETRLARDWKEQLRAKGLGIGELRSFREEDNRNLLIGYRLRQNSQIENARRALISGVFPIWKAGREKPEDLREFLERKNPAFKREVEGWWGVKEF